MVYSDLIKKIYMIFSLVEKIHPIFFPFLANRLAFQNDADKNIAKTVYIETNNSLLTLNYCTEITNSRKHAKLDSSICLPD